MRFSVYQISRKGGREKNEDRMGYCYTRDAGLFALADGMGGHPEGEVASQLALQMLAALFQRAAKPQIQDELMFLSRCLGNAHAAIQDYAFDKSLPENEQFAFLPKPFALSALVEKVKETMTA